MSPSHASTRSASASSPEPARRCRPRLAPVNMRDGDDPVSLRESLGGARGRRHLGPPRTGRRPVGDGGRRLRGGDPVRRPDDPRRRRGDPRAADHLCRGARLRALRGARMGGSALGPASKPARRRDHARRVPRPRFAQDGEGLPPRKRPDRRRHALRGGPRLLRRPGQRRVQRPRAALEEKESRRAGSERSSWAQRSIDPSTAARPSIWDAR